MSLDRRLCRLESLSAGCSECGHSPDAFEDYEVVWHDCEDAEEVEEEYCGACGRQTSFVVGWDDLKEMEPDGIPGGVGR